MSEPKLKPNTAEAYGSTFNRYLLPKWGRRRAEDISKADLAKLHAGLAATKATANRVLNYLSAAYSWAGENGYVSAGYNPTKGMSGTSKERRERFLNLDELGQVGRCDSGGGDD